MTRVEKKGGRVRVILFLSKEQEKAVIEAAKALGLSAKTATINLLISLGLKSLNRQIDNKDD